MSDTPPRWYGWTILAISSVALVATSPGQTYIVSLFQTAMREELGLGASTISAAYMVATLASASTMTWVGTLTDAIGPRRAMTFAAAGLGAASLVMSGAQGLVSLTVGFFLLRLCGQGALALTSGHALAMWFEKRLGFAEGVRLTAFGVGMATLPALVVATIAATGWRQAWLVVGLSAAGTIGLLVQLFHRDRPEDLGMTLDGLKPEDGATPEEAELEGDTLSVALRSAVLWVVAATTTASAMTATAVLFHLQALAQEHGLDATQVAPLMSTLALVSTSLCLVAGAIGDRFGPSLLFTLAGGLLAGACLCITGHLPFGLHAAMGAFGAAAALLSTSSTPALARRFGRAHHGAIRGAVSTIGVAGTAVGPVLLGLSMDAGSATPALLGFALYSALAGLAAGFVLRQ